MLADPFLPPMQISTGLVHILAGVPSCQSDFRPSHLVTLYDPTLFPQPFLSPPLGCALNGEARKLTYMASKQKNLETNPHDMGVISRQTFDKLQKTYNKAFGFSLL